MSCSRLLVMFVLLNFLSNTHALLEPNEMHWKEGNLSLVWGFIDTKYWIHIILRTLVIILDVPNFTNGTEKTFIAAGVLIDNSRILTSYNPFRELETDPKLAGKIMVALTTGSNTYMSRIKVITGIVCARQIAYGSPDEMFVWPDKRHSPLHDLIILRMDEEIGIAFSSHINFKTSWTSTFNFIWGGELGDYKNTLKAYVARPGDKINTPLWINSLVFTDEETLEGFHQLKTFEYGEDDAPLVDCEEWLPRQWGFFLCVRNIDEFSAISSGSSLFVRKTLFGVGSFAMFKNDTSILVFTDVRPYYHLIMDTCGDEEFLP